MNGKQTTKILPPWQRERAEILQRACVSFKGRIERGERRGKAARSVAYRYHRNPFKSDPTRKLQLSPTTLRRLFRAWTRNGEKASAFELHYKPRRSEFTREILIQFLDFVIASKHSSLKSAWENFCAGKPPLPSCYAVRWAFTTGRFYELRQQVKSICAALEKLDRLRAESENIFGNTSRPNMSPTTSIKPGPLANTNSSQAVLCRNGLSRSGTPVAPSGGYFTFSPRIKLVSLSTVRALHGVDAEKVTAMVDNFLHPQHIRFAFNVAVITGHGARELRFWVTEIAAPALVKGFTIEQAIDGILGTKKKFSRSELEIAWTIGSPQIARLIAGNSLRANGSFIDRKSLETFLWIRWTGNNPT